MVMWGTTALAHHYEQQVELLYAVFFTSSHLFICFTNPDVIQFVPSLIVRQEKDHVICLFFEG